MHKFHYWNTSHTRGTYVSYVLSDKSVIFPSHVISDNIIKVSVVQRIIYSIWYIT